jgi:hypothetical protein
MSFLSVPTPAKVNPLFGPGNYSFNLVKFPEVSFMLQSVELPSIQLGTAMMSTSVHDVPLPGETLSFSDLSFTFIVDEDMSNYMAIHEWLMGLGYPESHEMYRELLRNSKNTASLSELSKGYTDGVITIMGNYNVPVVQAVFVDAFPISIGGMNFNSNNSDSEPIIATATFAYAHYTLNKV